MSRPRGRRDEREKSQPIIAIKTEPGLRYGLKRRTLDQPAQAAFSEPFGNTVVIAWR